MATEKLSPNLILIQLEERRRALLGAANRGLFQAEERQQALIDAANRGLALVRQREQAVHDAVNRGLIQAQERAQALLDREQALLDTANRELIQAHEQVQAVTTSASILARQQRQAVHDALAGPLIQELRTQTYGWKACVQRLTAEGIPAPRGGPWSAIAVRRIAERLASDARPRRSRPSMEKSDSDTDTDQRKAVQVNTRRWTIDMGDASISEFVNDSGNAMRIQVESGQYGTLTFNLPIGGKFRYEPMSQTTSISILLDPEDEAIQGDNVIKFSQLKRDDP